MSLNTDLQTLKTNIEGVKSTLYTNLTNKGVTNISETDTLSTLVDKVSTITVGGGSGVSEIDFSPIGYDAELSAELNAKFNNDVAYSKALYDDWNPSNTSAYGLYRNDIKLVYAPYIDTSNVTSTAYMFCGCYNLKTVPLFDTSKVTNMETMFSGCTNLQTVPLFDTSNVTNMQYIFSGCTNLQTVPEFDTSKVDNMERMFYSCYSLKTVPFLNTSNATRMYSMFQGCSGLTSVPLFDTSKVTSMTYMFSGCTSLQTIPAFNTIKVNVTNYMFADCKNLQKVPELDTSNAKNMGYMFNGCKSLKIIEGISFKSFSDSTMNNYYIVGYSKNTSIRKAVFKDIGYQSNAKQFNTSYIDNWGVNTDEIPDARQSLIDSLITYSFDRATAGYQTCTITLSSTTKALLTEDEKAQITAKGFTLA